MKNTQIERIHNFAEALLTDWMNNHDLDPAGEFFESLNHLLQDVVDITIKVMSNVPVDLDQYRRE